LIDLKARAWLTCRELSSPLGISPSAVAQKFTGFMILTNTERKVIERVCLAEIERQQADQAAA
jgi:DNA-binding transcriptional regulator YdaS (Cro superfamily)